MKVNPNLSNDTIRLIENLNIPAKTKNKLFKLGPAEILEELQNDSSSTRKALNHNLALYQKELARMASYLTLNNKPKINLAAFKKICHAIIQLASPKKPEPILKDESNIHKKKFEEKKKEIKEEFETLQEEINNNVAEFSKTHKEIQKLESEMTSLALARSIKTYNNEMRAITQVTEQGYTVKPSMLVNAKKRSQDDIKDEELEAEFKALHDKIQKIQLEQKRLLDFDNQLKLHDSILNNIQSLKKNNLIPVSLKQTLEPLENEVKESKEQLLKNKEEYTSTQSKLGQLQKLPSWIKVFITQKQEAQKENQLKQNPTDESSGFNLKNN